ncbi:MAG: glycosyltransferase family 4 protein [Candidatus Diapherotrites archaeon]
MKAVLVCAGTLRKNMAGVEQSVYYLAKFLQKKKVDVEVYCVTDNPIGKTTYDTIPITEFPGIIFNKAFYFSLPLYFALAKENHDVIHAYGTNSLTTLAALAAKKKGQCMVITGASSISSSPLRKKLHPLMYAMYRFLAKKIDSLICVSAYEYELFKQNIPLPEEKYARIPNGIDVEKFASIKKKVQKHSILTVARLVKQKGVHRLVRALPLIMKKFPDAHLFIVGDGIEMKNLRAQVEEEKMSSHVTFEGYIQFENLDRLAQLYSTSHVFSLMADSESQGLVYTMAIASRTIIVATQSSAMMDFIQAKVALGVKNPDDSKEVAEKIMMAFTHPFPKGENKELVWSWDRIGGEILKLYGK